MKLIENQIIDMERALYGSNGIVVKNCFFDGPTDGKSAFKAALRIFYMDGSMYQK